jgi:hypothetical protein
VRLIEVLTARTSMIEASAHAEQEVTPDRSRKKRVIICKVVVNIFLSTTAFFWS